ncbi:MAG: tRNA (adenosine(37)-N6)-threonylcarbamoyltransferase complex dimerization subunit type 1 TsaB [Chloroflexi bacterium]|nr:tRNA (adenosine(37)-N6)-threonylcarbamoyltransferase complex dimerization subunit type 1 TsaB [Chloroflexota bacterium]
MAGTLILGIDTATRVAGLAVGDAHRLWAEETWYSVDTHTVELAPRLDRMMRALGRTADDLSGVGVTLGPGSFTGLRIGLSVAKGLALSHGLPLVGIPTLDTLAWPHAGQRGPLWAVIQAGRGRLCAACYGRAADGLALVEGPLLVTLDELAGRLGEGAFVCGELEAEETAALRARLGSGLRLPRPAENLRRAGFLVELARRRLANGEADDVETLAPLYLQHPT